MQYVIPAQDSLVSLFMSNTGDYFDYMLTIEKIKCGLFIAVVFILFIMIWGPYLRALSRKIWRTKGMLNMIPMELISKNEVLKKKFISGDLLKAVR